MQAIHAIAIRNSREHINSDVIDNESPVNEVEEAFEKTTLSITKDSNKVVKGKCDFYN